MPPKTILCNLSDSNDIINETRDEWIIEVLLALGVPEDVIELGFDDKSTSWDDYLTQMYDLGISVKLQSDGTIDIFKMIWIDGENEESSGWLPITEKQLVAQWKTPEKIKKIDGNKIYYEIHLKEWSISKMRI